MATRKTSQGNTPDKTLHIYTRVSTVVQSDKGTSLDSQLELGKKKAKDLKFSIEHLNEGGKSSHHDDIQGRPKLYELFQGESSTHYQRGTGCGFERAMNIQLTDKVVFDTVVQLHKGSNILKEEVKKRVYSEHGIKSAVASAEEMKGFERQLRKFESLFQNIQESIGNLEANRVLKRMDDKA